MSAFAYLQRSLVGHLLLVVLPLAVPGPYFDGPPKEYRGHHVSSPISKSTKLFLLTLTLASLSAITKYAGPLKDTPLPLLFIGGGLASLVAMVYSLRR